MEQPIMPLPVYNPADRVSAVSENIVDACRDERLAEASNCGGSVYSRHLPVGADNHNGTRSCFRNRLTCGTM